MSKRALLVVDIQNDYFPGGKWTLDGMEKAAGNAGRILNEARKEGDLVLFMRHEFPNEQGPFFLPGSEGAQINSSVKNLESEKVLLKNNVNSFRETELKKTLEAAGVKQLVIVGAMSNMCIDAATRAASDFGYEVTVVHDACACRELEFEAVTVPAVQVHAAFMASLKFAYAQVVSTEEYLASLKAKAGSGASR